MPSRSHASMDDWVLLVQLFMAHGQLELRELEKLARVSRDWREAVCDVLSTLRALGFCGYNVLLTGPDVLAVLARTPEGAALDVKNRKGDTPLLAALRAGQLEAAKILLGRGADASADDDQGETPLLLACRAGNLQLAKELLGKGADLSAGDDEGERRCWPQLLRGTPNLPWILWHGAQLWKHGGRMGPPCYPWPFSFKTRYASSLRRRRAPRGSNVRVRYTRPPLSSSWPRPISMRARSTRGSAAAPCRVCLWAKSACSCRRQTWTQRSRAVSSTCAPCSTIIKPFWAKMTSLDLVCDCECVCPVLQDPSR